MVKNMDTDKSRQLKRGAAATKEKEEGNLKRLLQEAKMIGNLRPGEELVYVPIPAGHTIELMVTSTVVDKQGSKNITTRGFNKNSFGDMIRFLIGGLEGVSKTVWNQNVAMLDQLKGKVVDTAKREQRHIDLEHKRLQGELSEDETKELAAMIEEIRLENLAEPEVEKVIEVATDPDKLLSGGKPAEMPDTLMVAGYYKITRGEADSQENQFWVAKDFDELGTDVIESCLALERSEDPKNVVDFLPEWKKSALKVIAERKLKELEKV